MTLTFISYENITSGFSIVKYLYFDFLNNDNRFIVTKDREVLEIKIAVDLDLDNIIVNLMVLSFNKYIKQHPKPVHLFFNFIIHKKNITGWTDGCKYMWNTPIIEFTFDLDIYRYCVTLKKKYVNKLPRRLNADFFIWGKIYENQTKMRAKMTNNAVEI